MAQAVRAKEQQLQRLRASPAASFSSARSNELIPEPPKDRRFRFRFPPSPRCGESIFEVEGVSHGYRRPTTVSAGEDAADNVKWVVRNVNLQIHRGDRIGIVGKNGIGKSTLLRLLGGLEEPLQGSVTVGSSTVKTGYFGQSQADLMDFDNSIVEEIQQALSANERDYSNGSREFMPLSDIRNLLAQFMFKGDDANKQIRMLSGGEKARVALCKLLVTPLNVLLLDEPTNHLDLVSKGALEDALLQFDGTLVVVSHDRHFMSKVVNKIIEFDDNGKIHVHYCDYLEYLTKKCSNEVQEKITSRYVDLNGQKIKLQNAKLVEFSTQPDRSKNFGGSGVTGGNSFKGIKNAKRYYGSS